MAGKMEIKTLKPIFTILLFLLFVFSIWHYLIVIHRNSYPSRAQHEARTAFYKAMINDETVKTILKIQSVTLNDVKVGWHGAHLTLHLYVDRKITDYTPVINRIQELGKDDSFYQLRPVISVLFHLGTPDTATWKPDQKFDVKIYRQHKLI